MSGLLGLIHAKRNPPKPVTESLSGKTILVTGANSGIGLEAAKKIAALEADTLIITTRNEQKGREAKEAIANAVTAKKGALAGVKTQIVPMVLDQGSFEGVRQFVKKLGDKYPTLDAAILNAGRVSIQFHQSPDGWEDTIQVNTLSTMLLGTLLLPLLIARAAEGTREAADHNIPSTTYKPHLTFVTSDSAWGVSPKGEKAWVESENPLEYLNDERNVPSGLDSAQRQYPRSKYMLEYCVRRLAATPLTKDAQGRPKVIISSTCPGMTKSDIGRDLTNPVIRFINWLIFALLARETEQGANIYVSSILQGDEMNGEMWKDDIKYKPSAFFSSEAGQKLGNKVWLEVRQLLLKADAGTKPFLESL